MPSGYAAANCYRVQQHNSRPNRNYLRRFLLFIDMNNTEPEVLPNNDVLYIFSMDKAPAFMQALNSLPSEEIGAFSVWNATRQKALLFESENNKIYDLEPVFCLSTDFREEHAELRAAAEAESLFYYPIYEDDKRLINEFFGLPEEQSQEFRDYLFEIGKSEIV